MNLEVVTPQGTAVTAEIDEVTAPGARGEFGVLPGHTPFLSALKPGVLRYRSKGASAATWAIGAGYVEVTGTDRVVVLTQRSQKAGDVDAAAARKELDEAEAGLKNPPDSAARAVLEQRRDWAQARIDAASAK
jgi:F-type H+-transporting ATPase subunit epsilon